MSGLFLWRAADHGSWLGSILYSVIPNWQLFLARRRDYAGKSTFTGAMLCQGVCYAICYAGAALAAGAVLFGGTGIELKTASKGWNR